jgi:hypothetical protein
MIVILTYSEQPRQAPFILLPHTRTNLLARHGTHLTDWVIRNLLLGTSLEGLCFAIPVVVRTSLVGMSP